MWPASHLELLSSNFSTPGWAVSLPTVRNINFLSKADCLQIPGHSTRQATVTKSVCPFLLPVLQWGMLNSLNKAEGCQCWMCPIDTLHGVEGIPLWTGKRQLYINLLHFCYRTIFLSSAGVSWDFWQLNLADLVTVWPFSTGHFFHNCEDTPRNWNQNVLCYDLNNLICD